MVAGGAIEEPVIGILGPLVSGIFGALIGLLPTEPEFEQFISSDEMAAGYAFHLLTSKILRYSGVYLFMLTAV